MNEFITPEKAQEIMTVAGYAPKTIFFPAVSFPPVMWDRCDSRFSIPKLCSQNNLLISLPRSHFFGSLSFRKICSVGRNMLPF